MFCIIEFSNTYSSKYFTKTQPTELPRENIKLLHVEYGIKYMVKFEILVDYSDRVELLTRSIYTLYRRKHRGINDKNGDTSK